MEQLAALAESGDELAAAVNPTALVEYMFDEFFHIKDDSAYTIATYYIGTKWDATDSDLDKVPAVASGDYVYDKDRIVTAIQTGIQYALDNQDNEDVYLNGAYRQGETGYTLAQMVLEAGVDSFADILNEAGGDYSGITYQYENNQEVTTLDITPLVEFYGIDGLAALVDDYVAHMDAHPWQPDMTVEGTYGYELEVLKAEEAAAAAAEAEASAVEEIEEPAEAPAVEEPAEETPAPEPEAAPAEEEAPAAESGSSSTAVVVVVILIVVIAAVAVVVVRKKKKK